MDYWYRYRDDLWKRVRTHNEPKKLDFCSRSPVLADQKTSDNIRRAQRMIEGYALCNDWQWFVTLTLNGKYRSRSDLDKFRLDLSQMIRRIRIRTETSVSYLLVPELHKSGDAWHMHGLFSDLPVSELRLFSEAEKIPPYIRKKLRAGDLVYDWPEYRRKFGYVVVEAVRNRDAAGRYVTKYVTKGMDSTARSVSVGDHLYFVSRGLNAPELVTKTDLPQQFWENENAPVCYPDAFPVDLVRGHSYTYDYGEVVWYERSRPAGSVAPAVRLSDRIDFVQTTLDYSSLE